VQEILTRAFARSASRDASAALPVPAFRQTRKNDAGDASATLVSGRPADLQSTGHTGGE
jgi:hypothetical protein